MNTHRTSICGLLSVILMSLSAVSCGTKAGVPVYLDASKPVEKRVEDALSRMTTKEKVAMLHAQSKFSSAGVPRLGIPEVWCTDGPHGIRAEVFWDKWSQAGWTNDSCTAFPALTCLSASWNPVLSELYGKSIGEEALYRKKTVLLGPGVNICRTLLNGRNFEYMGEDPVLASKMVVPYVKGVQENKVAVCVKHYALNNQELHRHTTNVIVDDRALNEIYLPAFKAAVQEGGAWSIMGSYNLYKNEHCCHNSALLNEKLKGEWGFDGVVISDWGGVHETPQAIANGMDIEFGTGTNGLSTEAKNPYDKYHLALPYLQKIENGEVGTDELDDKVRRILRMIMRTSMSADRGFGRFTCPEHYAAARKIAGEGIVLLRNEGVLPIAADTKANILVVGENAVKSLVVGGGSSSLKVQREILPLEGIKTAFPDANVTFERGYVGSQRTEQDGLKVASIEESRDADTMIADAVAAAKDADYVIFVGGLNKDRHQDCEDADRFSYALPYVQDTLVSALAAVTDKLVVVNISGTPVDMPWAEDADAILQAWYLGSEAGEALADVLCGDVNPSGKLPFTFPMKWEDGPIKTVQQYPGIKRENENVWDEEYSEGIFVGYRWYDSKGIKVRFPFGYGLSYTNFEWGKAKLSSRGGKVRVTVPVTNTGSVAGAEVVQVYVATANSAIERPAKELKGFDKVFVEPGKTVNAVIEFSRDDLRYWDVESSGWKLEKCDYAVVVCRDAATEVQALKLN